MATATANGFPTSQHHNDAHELLGDDPIQFVRQLSLESREAIFLELLREIRQHNGDRCVIPLFSPDGAELGHLTPPGWPIVYPDSPVPTLSQQELAEIRGRASNLGEAIPLEQGLQDLIQRVAVLAPPST